MIINLSKTKEIVFRWPNPYQCLFLNPIDDIVQMHEAKVLDVVLNHKFHFNSHKQLILRQCGRCLYLVKLLRKQGRPPEQLTIVTSSIQYTILAWGGFIKTD
jgi:hypothetical protein